MHVRRGKERGGRLVHDHDELSQRGAATPTVSTENLRSEYIGSTHKKEAIHCAGLEEQREGLHHSGPVVTAPQVAAEQSPMHPVFWTLAMA